MVHIVTYKLLGIETLAVFSTLGFAQRFSNEVGGKIYSETVDRLATNKELNPISAMADEIQAITPIEIPSDVDIGKMIKQIREGIFNSNRIPSSLFKL